MQNTSAAKPKPNRLPPSQLIGFVKRHRAPPLTMLPKSDILPQISPSPKHCSSDKTFNMSFTPTTTTTPATTTTTATTTGNLGTWNWKTPSSSPTKKPLGVAPLKTKPAAAKLPEGEIAMVRKFSEDADHLAPVEVVAVEERKRMVKESVTEEAVAVVDQVVQPVLEVKDELCCTTAVDAEADVAELSPRGGGDENEAASETSTKVTEDTALSDISATSPTKGQRTPEEWQKKTEQLVQKCLTILHCPDTTVPTKPAEGSRLYAKEFLSHLKSVRMSYFSFRNVPLALQRKGRLEVAHGFLSAGKVGMLCDTVSDIYARRSVLSEEDKALAKNHHMVAKSAMSSLMNYSDCSDDVTYFLRDHPSVLPAVLSWLEEWSGPHLAKELKANREVLLRMCLSVIHNVSMRDDNIHRLRELRANTILVPYLESHSDFYKLSAFASLADILTEEEADKLTASPHLARFLLKRLENALKAKDHRCYGWSVTELVRAVRRLARNDTNKRLLVEQGALPLLHEGVQSEFMDEKMGFMEALWVLSFDKQNMKEITQYEDLMDIVVQSSQDHALPPALRHSAAGVLWQCRGEMAGTEKYCKISKDISEKTKKNRQRRVGHRRIKGLDRRTTKVTKVSKFKEEEKKEEKGKEEEEKGKVEEEKGEEEEEEEEGGEQIGHVMLSYQWANQELVTEIRDILRHNGYTVWMDIDDMGGSTLQAMAAAVEDSFLVLICMSQKYKDSPNTRAEAEYAFQQRKKIIPLIMERGYRPDGWLGMILGAKLFYDFSGKYTFESRIQQLLKAVGREAASAAAATGGGGGGKGEQVDGGSGSGGGGGGGVNLAAGPSSLKKDESRSEKRIAPTFTSGVTRSTMPVPVSVTARPDINVQKVKAWTASDVKQWLTKFELNGTELERLTGREIAFLHKLRVQAPEFFYQTLDKKLHLTTLSGLMCFTDALDDLPTT